MQFKEDYNINNRNKIAFDVIITLLSPLSHIGESVGNQSNLKTLRISDLEGIVNEVFVYSGNGLRGKIRRLGVEGFLEKLNIQVTPAIHQTLFAGGYIDGGTGCDLELDAKIRRLLPPLSVLGTAKPKGLFGSKDAQMVGGRVNIGDAVLCCLESAEYIYNFFPPALPTEVLKGLEQVIEAKRQVEDDRVEAWLHRRERKVSGGDYTALLTEWMPYFEEKLKPYTQWLTWNQKFRFDSLKAPELQKHLHLAAAKGQLSLSGDKPKEKEKEKKTQQMIMGDWLLAQGAKLYSRWSGDITAIEEGFLADALLNFAQSPYLGGKNNVGHGLVQIDIYYRQGGETGHWIHISPTSQVISQKALESHQRYQSYLEEYREYIESNRNNPEIKELLGN